MKGRPQFATPGDRAEPGTIECKYAANDCERPVVINMFAQWELGPALRHNRIACPSQYGRDTPGNREHWFHTCLQQISNMGENKPRTIAFPFQIGCNLGGGNWSKYATMIDEFAACNQDTTVYMIKLLDNNNADEEAMLEMDPIWGNH